MWIFRCVFWIWVSSVVQIQCRAGICSTLVNEWRCSRIFLSAYFFDRCDARVLDPGSSSTYHGLQYQEELTFSANEFRRQ